MSSVIHMDTEQVRSVARQLSQASSDIQQDIIFLENRLRSLNWQSPSRDRFISDVAELQRKVQMHAELGAELGLRMQKEADEWERVDNSWSDIILRAEEYDWLTWTTTALGLGVDGGVDLIKYLTTIPLKDYRQTGRILNELFETRGWVGDMDDLGHLIKGVDGSKFFDAVFEGLPVGIEIFDDLGHGDSWQRSVGSEVLEYALEEGIKLVPVIGTAYLVYDFLLDIGGITSGGLELLGYHDQAVWLQNTVDQLDFVDNVSDWAFDTTSYYTSNPDHFFPDLANTAEQVVDFGSGLVDSAGDWVGSTSESIGDIFGF